MQLRIIYHYCLSWVYINFLLLFIYYDLELTLLNRFNGEDFLKRHKGKSIMFVGDSLSLNQWQSLTCMLHTAVPQAPHTSVRTGGLSTFTFPVRSSSKLFSFLFSWWSFTHCHNLNLSQIHIHPQRLLYLLSTTL